MEIESKIDGTVERVIQVLTAVAAPGDIRPLSVHARALGIPQSTVYRIVASLSRHGLVAPGSRGTYGPGLKLAALAAGAAPSDILNRVARPPLRRLARSVKATTHLGILDGDMVTYVVKEATRGPRLFTQEGGQLEAYSSAIGKVLLAAFEPERLEAYLGAGPFIALTPRTITDPEQLRREIDHVAACGFAVDDREVADDLQCVAVPIRDTHGEVVAAISLSRMALYAERLEPTAELLECARQIENRLGVDVPMA